MQGRSRARLEQLTLVTTEAESESFPVSLQLLAPSSLSHPPLQRVPAPRRAAPRLPLWRRLPPALQRLPRRLPPALQRLPRFPPALQRLHRRLLRAIPPRLRRSRGRRIASRLRGASLLRS